MTPTYFQTILSIVIIFACVTAFVSIYIGNRFTIPVPATIPEENNIDRQRVYIAKKIALSKTKSECDYIEALIQHFETTFIDSPDITIEVEEMRDSLQMQRNYIAVASLQKSLQK